MIDVRCTTTEVAGTTVLAIDGIVDLAALPRLHDELLRFARDCVGRRAAIDLDGASVLDDAALGLLLGAAATIRDGGGDLIVVCRDRRLRDRLAAMRFDRAVSVQGAIAEPVSDSSATSSYDHGMGEDRTP